jgi:hypothetical protein
MSTAKYKLIYVYDRTDTLEQVQMSHSMLCIAVLSGSCLLAGVVPVVCRG